MSNYTESYKYSQNFITDPILINKFIQKSEIEKDDLVLDIGAGKGSLTKALSSYAKKVIAIEVDEKLIPKLKENTYKIENVDIVSANFMDYKLPNGLYKVFANIPFNYSGKIVKKLFFDIAKAPSSSYLFLQVEFWNRYAGINKETQISLLLKPFYDMRIIENLKKEYFKPAPSVDTVFVEIKKKKVPLIGFNDYVDYRDFVKYTLFQGRSNITNNLKKVITWKQMKILSNNLRFNMKANPLDLTFEQWLSLYTFYRENVLEDKKSYVRGLSRKMH